MKLIDLNVDLRLVSKYRTELMGIAIIGVLIMHLFSIGQLPRTFPVKLISVIPSLAFTETFLLLSGLGIYHSLTRNNNISKFFKKRVNRLVIPYSLIAAVPVMLYVVINGEPIGYFFYRLSTLDFWFGDSTLGMWYIAATMVLYAMAPWLYKLGVFDSKRRLAVTLGGGIILLLMMYCISSEYWKSTGIWLAQTPAFLMGGYMMSRIDKGKKVGWKALLTVLSLTAILVICAIKIPFFLPFSRIMVRLCGLIVLCVFLNMFATSQKLLAVLRWFGEYSLELYIMHLLFFQPFKHSYIDSLYLISASIALSLLLCQPVHKMTNKLIEKWN